MSIKALSLKVHRMFSFRSAQASDSRSVLDAIGRSLAMIEFEPTGTILTANENFCSAMGYELSEIVGRHHSMFVEPEYGQSAEYKDFWSRLGRGEFDARQYKRIGKGGREIWIQASYNPIINEKGAVSKVVKIATDITADKLKNAEFEGKLAAISRAQAVIEFKVGGEIITANENFLDLFGYRLDEVVGKHHRMFVDPALIQQADYDEFWHKLGKGELVSASFKCKCKSGKELWVQASYNPIFDMNGRVMKIVKYSSDITDLTDIANGLARLADNNLEQRIERTFAPTFDKLRLDFNVAHDNLRNALLEVFHSTGTIHSGAQQISSSADELSRRTEHQAANLEETAAALDQITATVRKSAEGTSHAREVVTTADNDAKTSAVVVRQAVEAMDAISKSAQQISQIIGVIDEIAFQTNLLALNAGVEAARAGEAGRGFAVVASEVRALAQRSAEAAKEIKSLISTSTTQVDTGVKLVAETGKSLERILAQVAEINGVVGDIASGAREQSTGLGEVNTAINQMDEMTQQNAAMVEETTAASHALKQEAERLSALIGKFRVASRDAPRLAEGEAQSSRRLAPSASTRVAKVAASVQHTRGPVRRSNSQAKAVGRVDTADDQWAEF